MQMDFYLPRNWFVEYLWKPYLRKRGPRNSAGNIDFLDYGEEAAGVRRSRFTVQKGRGTESEGVYL